MHPHIEPFFDSATSTFSYVVHAGDGTPAAIVDRMSDEVEKALKDPGVRAKLAKLGVQPMQLGHKGFAEFVKDDYAKTTELTKAAGIAVKK